MLPSRRLTLEILAAIAITFAAILAFAKGVQAQAMMVTGAVAAESKSASATTGAIYFSLMNHGSAPDVLTGITVDGARLAELHETRDENGVMRMRPVERLEIPAGGHIVLLPGGMHVMLTGLEKPLVKGETLKLKLDFEKAGRIEVAVPVGDSPKVIEHNHASPEL